MNTLVPSMVAEAFKDSPIVAFSTGNVYPFVNVLHGGAAPTLRNGSMKLVGTANFNALDRGATGLASERKARNPVQTRLPATSGPHRDRLGVYPRSAPVAPTGNILRPLPDNRRELTWCYPLVAVQAGTQFISQPTVTKGSLSCSLSVIRYDNSIINAVSVNLEK